MRRMASASLVADALHLEHDTFGALNTSKGARLAGLQDNGVAAADRWVFLAAVSCLLVAVHG